MRGARQADEAVDRGGDQDQRLQPHIVADPLELEGEAETAIGDERKRMGRIHRQRGQHRKDVGHEAPFEPGAVAGFEIGRLDHRDAGLGELAAQRQPGHLLGFHQGPGALVDRLELLRRGEAVLAQRLDAGEVLAFEPGHPDHVEFVEVARRDRQEAQPLQQRMARIVGLGQHPLVEGEPRQLAVDEARRRSGSPTFDGSPGRISTICALVFTRPSCPASDMAGCRARF